MDLAERKKELIAGAVGRSLQFPPYFVTFKAFDDREALSKFVAEQDMQNAEQLQLACMNLAKHVSEDGVLIVEPWLYKDRYREGYYDLMTAETDTMKIARANTTKRDGDCSVIEFHFIVADKTGTEHFVEEHRMGLFSVDDYMTALLATGLKVQHDENGLMGRGLYIASRH